MRQTIKAVRLQHRDCVGSRTQESIMKDTTSMAYSFASCSIRVRNGNGLLEMIKRCILSFAITTVFVCSMARGQVLTLPSGFNYKEANVPPYVLLSSLRFADGNVVKSTAEWPARRAELMRTFQVNIFGRIPEAARHLPLQYRVLEHDTPALDGLAVRRQVIIPLTSQDDHGPVMHLLLYLPTHRVAASPVILGLNFDGNAAVIDDPEILATPVWQKGKTPGDPPQLVPFAESNRGSRASEWQVKMLLRRGYGLATVYYGDIDPDSKHALRLSIQSYYFDRGQTSQKPDDWGSLAAWAWGLIRALDYLQTDSQIDAKEVVVTGHSRLGKAADWAAAQDERFAALLSTESGKGGQSLYHREFGENIAHLEHSFPYWFCPNFEQWVGRDREIPADGNLLLALIAPRPLYVASAEQDLFSDPRGEFLAAQNVGQVYALFGKQGLDMTHMPEVNQPVMHDVAYHIRSGVHDVTAFDWEQYLTFLDLRFGSPLTRVAARTKKGTR